MLYSEDSHCIINISELLCPTNITVFCYIKYFLRQQTAIDGHVLRRDVITLAGITLVGGLRACSFCCEVVTDLMKDSDSEDLGTLRDNLKAQLKDSSVTTADLRVPGPASRRSVFFLSDMTI